MKSSTLGAITMAALLTGCAASPELVSCLQPNRRVAVEVTGVKIKAPAKPGAKAAKENVLLKTMAQGDTAFDHGSAMLKAGGKTEFDKLVDLLNNGVKKDPRPTEINSIIITGHSDRTELESGKADLDEERARNVQAYLTSKGLNPKLMFWEGKDAREPIPVTKFCID